MGQNICGYSRNELSNGRFSLTHSTLSQATITPHMAHNIGQGVRLGVSDKFGDFIPESAIWRQSGPVTLDTTLDSSIPVDYIDTDVIYGGCLVNHYGHFLLESLSRLWFAKENNLPIVWASGINIKSFQKEIFELLKLNIDRMQFIENPTKFKSVTIPSPGYIIQEGFHLVHASFLACRDVSTHTDIYSESKIYLSRGRFKSHIANVKNEEILEKILHANGWCIVYPEKLSVKSQLSIFSNAKYIAGIEGSAFHTAILCKKVLGEIILLRRPKPNRNYDTISERKNIRQTNILNNITPIGTEINHLEIKDPEFTAAEIISKTLI